MSRHPTWLSNGILVHLVSIGILFTAPAIIQKYREPWTLVLMSHKNTPRNETVASTAQRTVTASVKTLQQLSMPTSHSLLVISDNQVFAAGNIAPDARTQKHSRAHLAM